MKILFVGVQGSGKGTQAKIIADKLNIPHISTGDLLRGMNGELRGEIDSYINFGKLIPDELMLKILNKRFQDSDCEKGFILDGFPRNLNQAKELDKITQIDKVIEISISDKEALNRIAGRVTCKNCGTGYNLRTAPKPKKENVCDVCGEVLVQRKDDLNEDAIKKRIEIYHQETEPILEHYNSIKINGEQTIDKVTDEILMEM